MNLYLNKENNPDRLIQTFYNAGQNCETRVFFILNKTIREDWDLRLRYYNGVVYRPVVRPLRCELAVVTSISARHGRDEWPYK